jgi:TRAP-type uncharacterized transport system substrate-binding protein
MRTRTLALIALGAIVTSVAVAFIIHLLLGLLFLRIAVGPSAVTGRQAALALAQVFSADHPRVRVRTVVMPDLLAAARALDNEDVDLAIARSDVAPVDGQTLAILRRDAAMFIAPSGNAIDAVTKLRGMTVGVLGNDVPTVKLLDLILQHYDVDPASVRRADLAPEQIADAVRHRKVAAVFALAPPNSKRIPLLLAAIRKSGHGSPQIIAVDEAAAIAKRYPLLETLDIPKGTFDGSLPAPDDDITTLSVSYRLLARAAMPDWVAAEITRHVLTQKPKLAALDESLAGIEAPDTDDKSSALPIHSGTEAYLTGNLTSFSDQLQNALYWIGIAASAAVSLGALSAAAYRRVRPRQPPSRVMRLLEIWLAVRTANRGDLDGLEAETDEILDASVRADARGQAAESEVRLVSLLISHVREAIQRRRAGNGERSSGRSHTDHEIPSLTAEDVAR